MIVVSLDMFLNSTQDTFVKHKNDKFYLVKGNKNSGKTISMIFKTLYIKRNYCFDENDKILFITSKLEANLVVDIFNYINKSDLYVAIIPSENVQVHILSIEELYSLNMDKVYTHIIIDNIEEFDKEKISYIFSIFKKVSYSKVYFIQNSIESLSKVNLIVEYSRKILGEKENIFKFRYVLNSDERDEFTNISITPSLKYDEYIYREFVDLNTKNIKGYYEYINGNIYLDRGTFLQSLENDCLNVECLDSNLNIIGFLKIQNNFVLENLDLCFVKISDEAMSKRDIFRDDIILVSKNKNINDGDIVVILKDNNLYAREFYFKCNEKKFISSEFIFDDIELDSTINVIGVILGYIRTY